MKIRYCTCEKDSKEIFSHGFLLTGVIVYPIFEIGLLTMTIWDFDVFLFALLAFLTIQWLWLWIEFGRQARFLGHSRECARRYAILATLATCQGYSPEYGKLRGYKSAIKVKTEQILGKRKSNRLHRVAAVFGTMTLVALICWQSYDSLAMSRRGITDSMPRYTPVLTEAVWLAIFLPIGCLLAYEHLRAWIKSTIALKVMLTMCAVLLWLGSIFVLSKYARVDFWSNTRDASLIVGIVLVVGILMVFAEDVWRKHQKKKRRKRR